MKFKIPLEKFCPPRSNVKRMARQLRTINLTYIQNVSRSESFVRDMKTYLEEDFAADYSKVLEKKLCALVVKWEAQLLATTAKAAAVQSICKKIETCSKCKLPWSLKEIESAIGFVKKLFNSPAQTI